MLDGALDLPIAGNIHAKLPQGIPCFDVHGTASLFVRVDQGLDDLADVPLIDRACMVQSGNDSAQRQVRGGVHDDSFRVRVGTRTMTEAGAASSCPGGGFPS